MFRRDRPFFFKCSAASNADWMTGNSGAKRVTVLTKLPLSNEVVLVQLEVCLRSKALRVPVSPVFSKVMDPRSSISAPDHVTFKARERGEAAALVPDADAASGDA
jgi:hypothetical protein